LNKKLIEHSGFTESGLLIWGAILGLSENRFSVVVFGRPTHDLIDKNLRSGNPVTGKYYMKAGSGTGCLFQENPT
jgi:hypothetical protein